MIPIFEELQDSLKCFSKQQNEREEIWDEIRLLRRAGLFLKNKRNKENDVLCPVLFQHAMNASCL